MFNFTRKVNISFDEYGAFERPFSPLNPGYGQYNMARVHSKFDPERKYILHDPDNMADHQFPGGDVIRMLSMASIQLALLRHADNMPARDFPGGDMVKLLSMTSIQLAILRHADRVKLSCMTGGLQSLVASNREHVWIPATRYAFLQLFEYAKGTSMQVTVDSPTFDMSGYAIDDTSQYTGKNNVNYIDSACAWNKEKEQLTVFVINRNQTEEYPLDLDIRGFEGYTKCTHYEMFSKDFDLKSEYGKDWNKPSVNSASSIKEGIANAKIQPLSWNVFVFSK